MIKHSIDRLRPTLLVGTGTLLGMMMMVGWGAYSSMAQGTSAQAGCQSFPQTGHKICGKFLDYWTGHGGLAQQGYPLSEEFTETSLLNGKPYTVQYFERAVFELHPENKAPYDVLLSQLGTFLGQAKYGQGFPATAGEVPFYEDRTDPVAALVSFYNAINRKEYDRAYSYYQGSPNPDPALAGPLDQWTKGYADTASVTLAAGKAVQDAGAGNIYASFPVVITSRHTNGSTQTFSGCYFMHRVNTGISENRNDELWSITAAKLTVAPANISVDQILAQTCSR
ncbi:MAG: hypothetical protein M3014_12990 [Chloroflexota bacterium]|nr:hypothetical protein [Chloroflexota bacterium]